MPLRSGHAPGAEYSRGPPAHHGAGGVGADVSRGTAESHPPARAGCRLGLPRWQRHQRNQVMDSPVFENLSAFIEAWLAALDRLESREGQIVFDYATRRSTMADLATVNGVSRERMRQIVDHHFDAITVAQANCDGPIGQAVSSLGLWAERAGLELAYRFRRCSSAQEDRFARQLITLSAVRPAQRPWLNVAWALLPAPQPSRPSLKRVYPEAERALWEAATPLSPQQLRAALNTLDPVLAQWPQLDLALHLLAVSGVAPDPETGRYLLGHGWKLGYRRDRLLIRYYMARALREAGRCMTIGELAAAATAQVCADGLFRRYSFQQARNALSGNRRFKWTGRSTYGLAEWDVGHTDPARDGHARHGLAGEILHRLRTSPEPVHISEMRNHLEARFAATMGTINSSIRCLEGNSLRVDEDGYLHRWDCPVECEDAPVDYRPEPVERIEPANPAYGASSRQIVPDDLPPDLQPNRQYGRPGKPRPSRGIRMAKLLRDQEAFLSEWRAATLSLPQRDRRMLEDVILRRRTLAAVAKENNLTRASVRQIVYGCIGLLRGAARGNPQGELGHAAHAVRELSETAGIETWRLRPMTRGGRDDVGSMLVRLRAIAPEQVWLTLAVCCLVEAPTEPRPNLDDVADHAQKVLLAHPSGLRPRDLRRRLEWWRKAMDAWPRLEMGSFITARMNTVTTTDGKAVFEPYYRKTVLLSKTMAHRLELALRQAGQCLHAEELAERLGRDSTVGGQQSAHLAPARVRAVSRVLNRDPRFQWVGMGTYGLTEWDVGLTAPYRESGKKPSVNVEIDHLLRDRDSIPMTELMEHMNRRLRVPEKTVLGAIRRNPHAEIRNDTLHKVAPNDPERLACRNLRKTKILGFYEKTTPATVDQVMNCRRQVDVLRQVAICHGGVADIGEAAELVRAAKMTTTGRRSIAASFYTHIGRSKEWALLGYGKAWLLDCGPVPEELGV